MQVCSRIWVKKDNKNYLGVGRVEILRGVAQTGSISQSAKKMKMSYKAAWDSVDAINNLSDDALVERFIGGKGGSGTRLTKDGIKAIEAFDALDSAKEAFCEYFGECKDLDELKECAMRLRELIKKN
ncbi:winged helix-turn-helix domain-containing protein [Helicobacter sp. 23-1045]